MNLSDDGVTLKLNWFSSVFGLKVFCHTMLPGQIDAPLLMVPSLVFSILVVRV